MPPNGGAHSSFENDRRGTEAPVPRCTQSDCPAQEVPILFHQFRFISTSVVAPTTVFDHIRRVWSFHGPRRFVLVLFVAVTKKMKRMMLRASVECRLRLVYVQL